MSMRILPAALLVVLALPSAAFAAAQNFSQLANEVAQFFGSATTDLIMLAIVIYFWGIASALFKQGTDREKIRTLLVWGVVVIFCAVSLWGIVQLLQNTLFGQGFDATNGTGSVGGSNCASLNCTFGD